MKHPITRSLSVLLAVILILGMMPMSAVAGPSEETIYEAEVFITFPIAGAHPDLTGVPAYDGEPFRVDEVHFFELDPEGHPMGAFLTEEYTFEANRGYACQVSLIPKENR